MGKNTATSTTPRKAAAKKAAVIQNAPVNLERPTKDLHAISAEQAAADAEANKTLVKDATTQFVEQMLGTNKPATQTPPVAMEAFNAELALLKQKFGVNADVKVTAPKPAKMQQHGVTRPGAETLCGKVWATADAISLAIHGICSIALLKEHADIKGINDHTVKTQYAKWRQYNGVTGRQPKIHAVHQAQGEYAGIPEAKPAQAE